MGTEVLSENDQEKCHYCEKFANVGDEQYCEDCLAFGQCRGCEAIDSEIEGGGDYCLTCQDDREWSMTRGGQ